MEKQIKNLFYVALPYLPLLIALIVTVYLKSWIPSLILLTVFIIFVIFKMRGGKK